MGHADADRPQDVELYKVLLTFIKQRLLHVDNVLSTPPVRRIEIESCALQVRISLEHLVLSTLVANRPATAAVVEAFAKKSASDARSIVKRINKDYWPIPFDMERHPSKDGVIKMAEPSDPYLKEPEWGRAYGYCSSILHAANPYTYVTGSRTSSNAGDWDRITQLRDYSNKIQRLIKNHQIYLSEIDHSFICAVPENDKEEPSVTVFVRTPKEDQ
ncbi:hypothetical protein ACGFMK_31930 [Amycolatopsis sp. NPDC049252]|uniref:hypothetical protein n=1 Tax=Amycolatopsis sp. NPDC049252 TaxID=3363933 RepID=UPI003723F4CA